MAHKVTFTIPERDLGKSDVEFSVSDGGTKIGTLKVSKGTVDWVPRDHTKAYYLGWKDFEKMMMENGNKEK
jgi:hypothetical protein